MIIVIPLQNMARYLVINFLAWMFIFSGTELHQLLRIPFLVSHYHQHRRLDNSMDIWNFLKLHYLNIHLNDNDEKDDEQLPFKSSASITHIDPTCTYTEMVHSGSFPSPAIFFPVFHKQGSPTDKVYGIFHPPRLVQLFIS